MLGTALFEGPCWTSGLGTRQEAGACQHAAAEQTTTTARRHICAVQRGSHSHTWLSGHVGRGCCTEGRNCLFCSY